MFLLQGIPESTGLIALSLALLRVPLRLKRIIATGTVLALVLFTARSIPLTFGIHMAIGIFLIVIIIDRATHITITKNFIAVLVSFSTLLFLEQLMMIIFFAVTKLDPNTIVVENNNLLWKLAGLPQAVLLIIIALLISKLIKPREDAWKI